MLIPVRTRTMANATAQATPMERAAFIIPRETVPAREVFHLLVEHLDGGFRFDNIIPDQDADGDQKPLEVPLAQATPQQAAHGAKPTFTPVKNRTRPR